MTVLTCKVPGATGKEAKKMVRAAKTLNLKLVDVYLRGTWRITGRKYRDERLTYIGKAKLHEDRFFTEVHRGEEMLWLPVEPDFKYPSDNTAAFLMFMEE